MQSRIPALNAARRLHLYFGVFIAPAILFFALTGALQTFSLHETSRGSAYKPPVWLVRAGQLHKKQVLTLPVRRAPGSPAAAPSPAPRRPGNLPLKVFFAAVALGLCSSTATGLWISWKYSRSRAALSLTLLAGIAVPVLLILL